VFVSAESPHNSRALVFSGHDFDLYLQFHFFFWPHGFSLPHIVKYLAPSFLWNNHGNTLSSSKSVLFSLHSFPPFFHFLLSTNLPLMFSGSMGGYLQVIPCSTNSSFPPFLFACTQLFTSCLRSFLVSGFLTNPMPRNSFPFQYFGLSMAFSLCTPPPYLLSTLQYKNHVPLVLAQPPRALYFLFLRDLLPHKYFSASSTCSTCHNFFL